MWFISFLKQVKAYFVHFHLTMQPDRCSLCAKKVGEKNLTRIWYSETADDVCDACLHPPQSIKFIKERR